MKKAIICLSIFSMVLHAGLKEDIAKEDAIEKENIAKKEKITQQKNLRNENIKLMKEIKAKYFNEFCNIVYVSSDVDFTEKCEDKTYTLDELSKLYDDADELPNKTEKIEAKCAKEIKDFFTKSISKEDRLIYKQLLINESIANDSGTVLPCLPKVKNELSHYKEVIKAEYRDPGKKYLNTYLGEIRALLLQNFKYPKMAQKLKMQGDVRIAFIFGTDGSVENIKIIESSGSEILDEDAVALIKKTASSFPKPSKSVGFSVPLSYVLH